MRSVYMDMLLCVCVCQCIHGRDHVEVRGQPQVSFSRTSSTFFETGIYYRLGALRFSRAGRLVSHSNPPVSTFQGLRLQECVTTSDACVWVPRIELGSSSFQDQRFTTEPLPSSMYTIYLVHGTRYEYRCVRLSNPSIFFLFQGR